MGHPFPEQITNGKAPWNQASLGGGRRQNVHPSCELAVALTPLPSKWKWEGEGNKSSHSTFVNWLRWHYLDCWVRSKHSFFFRNSDLSTKRQNGMRAGGSTFRKNRRHSSSDSYDPPIPDLPTNCSHHYKIVTLSMAIIVSHTFFPFCTVIFLQRKWCVFSLNSQNLEW